ncbi:Eco57I restriction-modification methylase domain-containing protein [Acanthopleuribacter pedis]|uniref:site-specific DNA-methyltransferase (adenine-specific) n=1 Tax=Acanthopleuribacter pedis TaxID=442870 RepID=A0A8J7Q3W1_9BACT|nr:DNA methyltransferase [Acanthopleuribacter pedis]MBO1320092.1 Eco57I restriction-modification methylase domain-containing protein [Acanthopleuribacter pedis]
MRYQKYAPQSLSVFGDFAKLLRPFPHNDLRNLGVPDRLLDQVFRVCIGHKPYCLFFELILSEQCPKDAYTAIAGGIAACMARQGHEYAVFTVVHAGSANAHLIFWRRREDLHQRALFHLDLVFTHQSLFERQVLDLLHKLNSERVPALFSLLQNHQHHKPFFAVLRRHLGKLETKNVAGYHALVDLVLKLIFLIFVQHKRWLNHDPYYLETQIAHCCARSLSILTVFLQPLFARLEGLPVAEPLPLGQLPLLGGGLFHFDRTALPLIENRWLFDLVQALLNNFSYSLLESRPGRTVAGIGPEVLGAVFEHLLLVDDRKQQGTYYTPGFLAHKQAKAAITAWLDHKQCGDDPLARRDAVADIRILDPSCGSGTYLTAAFQALLDIHLAVLPPDQHRNGRLFDLKQQIMLRNLFGVDINPVAVRLTEVRLWLNLIQDIEVEDPAKAPALPNLQHQLRAGDFLDLHVPTDKKQVKQWPKYAQLEQLRAKFPTSQAPQRMNLLRHMLRLEGELADYLTACRQKALKDITKTQLAQPCLPGCRQGRRKVTWRVPREPGKQLHVMFSRVMLEQGFDCIIGNPPWLAAGRIDKGAAASLRAGLPVPRGVVLSGQVDLSVYFTAASLALLRPNGHLSFLLPAKILQAPYAASLRQFLLNQCRIHYLYDYGLKQGQLFKADTFPVAVGAGLLQQPNQPSKTHQVAIEIHEGDDNRCFTRDQTQIADRFGLWHLYEGPAIRGDPRRPSLGELGFKPQRGVVTGAKRSFVFEQPPIHLAKARFRPLLRGRDIQPDGLQPGRFIYWPFQTKTAWNRKLGFQEHTFLKNADKVRWQSGRPSLPYAARPFSPWLLIWKYLAKRWTVGLIQGGWCIPDQTTYYLSCSHFAQAYRLFAYFNSAEADAQLRAIAERGKDFCYFYYAHTVACLQLPCDWQDVALTIPPEKTCFTPAEGVNLWPC